MMRSPLIHIEKQQQGQEVFPESNLVIRDALANTVAVKRKGDDWISLSFTFTPSVSGS
jgi:hypothetical protein